MVTNSCSILYNFGIITADYNINYCSINCTYFCILFKFLKLPVVSIWSTVALKLGYLKDSNAAAHSVDAGIS